MSDTLDVVLVGAVVGVETRNGETDGRKWSMTDVTLMRPNLDKFTVTLGDDQRAPLAGEGVKYRVRLSGSARGLRARVLAEAPYELTGPLASLDIAGLEALV